MNKDITVIVVIQLRYQLIIYSFLLLPTLTGNKRLEVRVGGVTYHGCAIKHRFLNDDQQQTDSVTLTAVAVAQRSAGPPTDRHVVT